MVGDSVTDGVKVSVGTDVSVSVWEAVGVEVDVSVTGAIIGVVVNGTSVDGAHADTNKSTRKTTWDSFISILQIKRKATFCKLTIKPDISSHRVEDFVLVESRSRDVVPFENLRFDCATLRSARKSFVRLIWKSLICCNFLQGDIAKRVALRE
jgi:hypothetical protein